MRNSRRNHLLYPALLLLALAVLFSTPLAYAGRAICRSDPIVVLSDGSVVTLYADIESDVQNIASVAYSLQVPAGLSVVSVEHPIAETSDLETFSFTASGTKGEFKATTLVTLHDGTKKKVTAYMDAQLPNKPKTASLKKDGETHKPVLITVKVN